MLGSLPQDLKHASRLLAKKPGFAVVAILTLALGIGANTTIFTVANAVLFRALPYDEPERLVQIWNNFRGHQMENVVFSHLEYLDYRPRLRQIEDIAVYGQNSQTLKIKGEPEQVWTSNVSANLFDLLGVQPLHGRTFTPEENQPGRGNVVVLGHGLWQRRFGGDPAIIGKQVVLEGQPHLVAGVMPATFRSPATLAELWRPITFGGEMMEERQRGSRSLWMIGRLKRETSLEQARAEMATLAQQIAAERTEQYPPQIGHAVTVVPLHEQVTGGVRRALLILLGAVGLVLLIACTNVANLLLARATDRHREMAVRAALGAGRVRVLSQMLTESILLGLAGGAAGTLLAVWGVDLLVQWMPPGGLPRLEEVAVSGPVLWFSLGLSLLTGVLFGLAPAVQASSLNLTEALKAGGRTSEGVERRRMRSLLVISEVALALILLAGAGLMIRGFARLISIPPGFNPDNALTMRIALLPAKYPARPPQISFFRQLTERVRALPGVEAVGLVTSLPFSGWRNDWSISLEGVPGKDGSEGSTLPPANYFAVNTDYFRSMGIPLLRGRGFEAADASGTPAVIVNQTLAQRFWPGQEPIGKRLRMGGAGSRWPWRTIVGVVGNVRQSDLETAVMPEIFVLNEDERKPPAPSMFLVARTSMDPTSLAAPIRRQVAALDPDQAVANIRTLAERVALSLTERRFNLLLLGIFAGVALTLAAVGIYGVMAYAVSQRTREIGVRVALGAQKGDVFRLVVGQGMRLAGVGIAVGLVGAVGLTRFLEALLFEVKATDPLTFASVALVLAAVAFLACWVPARRAARVDPIVALRYE